MAKAPVSILSHWYHLFEGLQASPKEFYSAVERAIAARSLPSVQTGRIDWHEAGPLSPKREYLRIIYKQHVFDICGAPYGSGFFVSSWLGELPSGCLAVFSGIPFLGFVLDWLSGRNTYYRFDTALMFQTSVHNAVMEVLDEMGKAKGLRSLTEGERKPLLKGIFSR